MAAKAKQELSRAIELVAEAQRITADLTRPSTRIFWTDLVLTAKAPWGYSDRQLELWRAGLTVTEEQVLSQPIFVVEDNGVVGFYSLKFSDGVCELDNLWVVPTEMGRGSGAALLAHAAGVAKKRGSEQIRIDADPHVELGKLHLDMFEGE